MKLYLNDGWFFTPEYDPALLTAADGEGLEPVRLPHTVCQLPLNYCNEQDYQKVSGYLRFIDAPEEWRGKSVQLRFYGAAHEAEVFCNGVSLLKHRCGYTAFTADLSGHLRYGERNSIAVRLDSRETLNQPPFGYAIDYMTFGGIYRGVELIVKEPQHFTELFVRGDDEGVLHISCSAKAAGGKLTLGAEVFEAGSGRPAAVLEPQGSMCPRLRVPGAKLWSTDSPNLYTVRLTLYSDGVPVDTEDVRTGFRSVEFRADGFYLNGKKLLIRGLNRHQSWPYMGYAVPDRAQALDADILKKELGCNAVRTSHYPQSHAFIDRCDELGLLVFMEFPGWQHVGDGSWKEQAIVNLNEMIRQYRNHPSIFIWGVRINESQDDDTFYRRTNALAHSLDPSRPTGGVRNFRKSHLLEDVYTYNDFSHTGENYGCEKKSAVTPDMSKGYLITEYNGHMFPTKPYDWEGKRTEHALRHANVLAAAAAEEGISGSFGWCMFDYNTHCDFGSGDRVCYHGVMDAFRNPKTAAAVYASQGTEIEDGLVFQVASAMDIGEYPAGNLGDVWVFTNASQVALYKNGQRAATFRPDAKGRYASLPHPPIRVDDIIGDLLELNEGYDAKTAKTVKAALKGVAQGSLAGLPPASAIAAAKLMLFKGFTYEKGVELFQKYTGNWGGKATSWHFVAEDADGRRLGEIVREPAVSMRLDVRADTDMLTDGPTWDMATVRFRVVDQNGNLLPYYNGVVRLSIEGPGELVGPELISPMGGQAGTYIRTVGQAGDVTLRLSAAGMEEQVLSFAVDVNKGDCYE